MAAVLQLGCGTRPKPGAINHDRVQHSPDVDVAWDLDQLPWPWVDEQFDRVIALDVMEHLRIDIWQWLAETWRILKPGGLFLLRVPAWNNPNSYRDPTHHDLRSLWHEETIDYFCPATQLWRDYGRFYPGSELGRWWERVSVERTNPDERHGIGALAIVIRKKA